MPSASTRKAHGKEGIYLLLTTRRKCSQEQQHNYHDNFQIYFNVYNAIDETKFAFRILAANVDNFSSPESAAKGEY